MGNSPAAHRRARLASSDRHEHTGGKRASPTPAGKSGSIRPITTSPTRAARWSCSPAGDCDEARRLYPRNSESQGSRSYETVSQCYISPGCHAELERSICFSDTLRKADSSLAAQNDLATRSLTRRGRNDELIFFAAFACLRHCSGHALQEILRAWLRFCRAGRLVLKQTTRPSQ